MAEIPKIVGQRLRTIAEPGEHPDPNMLTAFTERSLRKRDRIQVLEHLSACSSCREIVSLSTTLPAVVDAAPVIAVGSGWSSLPVLRWGAVLACVVVVSAAVTLRHYHQQTRQIAVVTLQGKTAAETQGSVANSAIQKKAASVQAPASEAKSIGKQGVSRQPAIAPAANYAAMNSRPIEMAEARTANAFADVPGRAKDAFAESQDAPAEKSVDSLLARKGSAASMTAASPAMVPANLVPRWTLSADGTLQRSLDSGRSWQTITVSNRAVFRALAANGLDIWVGGPAGALFHSSDAGQRWTQVRPVANGEVLEDDIIGVEFTDALNGRVTSSIEETWTTADAGQTWQKE